MKRTARPTLVRRISFVLMCSLSFFTLDVQAAALQFRLQKVAGSFNDPIDATTFPGNEQSLVVAERASGYIVLHQPSPPSPGGMQAPNLRAIMLDLTDKADFGAVAFNGILGIAFHPRFLDGRQYRYLYVRYTKISMSAIPSRISQQA